MLAAVSDHDIPGFVGKMVVLLKLLGDRRSQSRFSCRWTVAGFTLIQRRFSSLSNMLWGVKVRFARAEATRVRPSAFIALAFAEMTSVMAGLTRLI